MNNTAALLAEGREASGLSFEAVRDEVRDRLGPAYTPTSKTITNYHTPGKAPKKPDLMLLFALADIYGIESSIIVGPFHSGIRELVARSRCSSIVAGQSP